MDYLEELGGFELGSTGLSEIMSLIRHNKVRRALELLGYTIIAFDTGVFYTQWVDADFYLSPPRAGSQLEFFNLGGLNGFEAMILKSSGAFILIDAAKVPGLFQRLIPDVDNPRIISYERTLFVLDQLRVDKVGSIRSPKFIYAHLIIPHYPYVFGPDGEFVVEDKSDLDIEAYRDQVIYLNKRIDEIVREIIMNSEVTPIVILQGDHGQRLIPDEIYERMAILNAYYIPDAGDQLLYPAISPVNTFRIIFNTYFGSNFQLLEDISYYSTWKLPYDFEVIQDQRPGCYGD